MDQKTMRGEPRFPRVNTNFLSIFKIFFFYVFYNASLHVNHSSSPPMTTVLKYLLCERIWDAHDTKSCLHFVTILLPFTLWIRDFHFGTCLIFRVAFCRVPPIVKRGDKINELHLTGVMMKRQALNIIWISRFLSTRILSLKKIFY